MTKSEKHPGEGENQMLLTSPRPVVIATVVVILILSFTVATWELWGNVGMQFAGVVTSGVLTAALVGLYYHQTKLLGDQIDLRTQEIDREVQINHTETLRQRIHAWLGTDEIPKTTDSVEDLIQDSGERLPKVTATDVEPPENYVLSYGNTDEFRVVPLGLERDRYFKDLLENHAPELKQRKESIERLYASFTEHRSRFKQEFKGVTLREDDIQAKPDVYLGDCIFESIVKIERGRSDDWDYELEAIMNAFDDGGNRSPDDDELRFMEGIRTRRSIYRVISDEGSVHDIPNETACELAKEAVRESVNQIDLEDKPYRNAVESAELLDSLETEIRELRMELIEYAGRPVFPGQCKYLDEAALKSTTDER